MVWAKMEPKQMACCLLHWRVTLMRNQFHLHYAKNIVPFQEAIQISRTWEEKEKEGTDQNLKKKTNRPQTLDY